MFNITDQNASICYQCYSNSSTYAFVFHWNKKFPKQYYLDLKLEPRSSIIYMHEYVSNLPMNVTKRNTIWVSSNNAVSILSKSWYEIEKNWALDLSWWKKKKSARFQNQNDESSSTMFVVDRVV